MSTEITTFQCAKEMPYAESAYIREKAKYLYEKLFKNLPLINQDPTLAFKKGECVYIPDLHGDFIHLIITLYRFNLIEKDLNLINDYKYIFLGDLYDRAPDADVIDLWINKQIKNNIQIYRLIGNHEMAFFERDEDGYPLIFPSQDSIKDMSSNFKITEDLLKNSKEGNIIAAYAKENTLYVHSFIISDDFKELGLEKNTDPLKLAHTLNERFKKCSEIAYNLFLEQKKKNKFDWKQILKPFNNDPIFNLYKSKNDINISFISRRTGLPTLKIYPIELDTEIPDNIYQIVGHTPVFLFDIPDKELIHRPFILRSKTGGGRIQFSDVGIGYYYKPDTERPEVFLKP